MHGKALKNAYESIHYVSTMKESEQKLFQNEIWDFAWSTEYSS